MNEYPNDTYRLALSEFCRVANLGPSSTLSHSRAEKAALAAYPLLKKAVMEELKADEDAKPDTAHRIVLDWVTGEYESEHELLKRLSQVVL